MMCCPSLTGHHTVPTITASGHIPRIPSSLRGSTLPSSISVRPSLHPREPLARQDPRGCWLGECGRLCTHTREVSRTAGILYRKLMGVYSSVFCNIDKEMICSSEVRCDPACLPTGHLRHSRFPQISFVRRCFSQFSIWPLHFIHILLEFLKVSTDFQITAPFPFLNTSPAFSVSPACCQFFQ